MIIARFLPAKWEAHKKFCAAGVAALLCLSLPSWADDPPAYEADPDLLNIGGYVVFFDVHGPLSYASASSLPESSTDVGEVQGHACQHGLTLPFSANLKAESGSVGAALGKGGFVAALDHLRKDHPQINGIYDVRVDLHEVRILGIYSKLCTEVTARAFKHQT